MALLREYEPQRFSDGGSGEVELAFDEMEVSTLWRLEEYMREYQSKQQEATNGNLHAVDEDDDSEESDE